MFFRMNRDGMVPAPIPVYIEMGWRDRAQERKRRAENAAHDGHWPVAADNALAPYGLRLFPMTMAGCFTSMMSVSIAGGLAARSGTAAK
jgi:hypothetical protein